MTENETGEGQGKPDKSGKPPETKPPEPELDMTKKVEQMVTDRLEAKGKELTEYEARVDKKLVDLREKTAFIKDQGQSLAGDAVAGKSEEEKKEEEAKAAANKLAGGLGEIE